MAALSSNEARTTSLFNTFCTTCRFAGMLIEDLISYDDDIPDYIVNVSNELLNKVLRLTNSIYKISGTRVEEEKAEKVEGPFNCKEKITGPLEYKSTNELTRSTPQLYIEANKTNSNSETSPFISHNEPETQKMNTYSSPEIIKPLKISHNDTLSKQSIPSYSPQQGQKQKNVGYRSFSATKASAGVTDQEASTSKQKGDDSKKKKFLITNNLNTLMKKLAFAPTESIYYCHLCDCHVGAINWFQHLKVIRHIPASNHSSFRLVKCSHCQLNLFVYKDTASHFFFFHKNIIHPGETDVKMKVLGKAASVSFQ